MKVQRSVKRKVLLFDTLPPQRTRHAAEVCCGYLPGLKDKRKVDICSSAGSGSLSMQLGLLHNTGNAGLLDPQHTPPLPKHYHHLVSNDIVTADSRLVSWLDQ